MENRQQQILSEIKSMMASVRSQLEMLDAKIAEFQQIVDSEDLAEEPIDIEIELDDIPEAVAVEEIAAPVELPEEEPVVEMILEPEEVRTEEPVAEDGVEPATDVVTFADRAEEEAKPTINDILAADCAWRRDMPGAQVRDIRSAISLNDRVIFINLLFEEDAQSFVNALSRINSMETLDEAVGFITSEFPSWDMNSELVYRFMMAVRRKLQ